MNKIGTFQKKRDSDPFKIALMRDSSRLSKPTHVEGRPKTATIKRKQSKVRQINTKEYATQLKPT